MKVIRISCLILLSALSAVAQGTLIFNNYIPGQVVAPIYGTEAGDGTGQKTGNTAAGQPAGTQVYTGGRVEGTGWSAQLFAAPGVQLESALVAVSPVTTFRTGATAGFIEPITVVLSGFPTATSEATFQMRVWDNANGLYPTWADAQPAWLNGTIVAAASPLSHGLTTGATTWLRSFNVYFVPEPSAVALSVLGGIGFWLCRRWFQRASVAE